MKFRQRIPAFRALVSAHHWNRDKIEAFQSKQLRILVRHAYDRVPFYRQLFDKHGLNPLDVSGMKDLHLIPTTRKRDLVGSPEENNLVDGIKRSNLVCRKTNGSTGEPFVFYSSKFEDSLLSTFRLFASLRLGMRITDRQVRVRLPHVRSYGKVALLLKTLSLFRIYNVSTMQLPEKALIEIRKIRPQVIAGLASMVYQIALKMTDKDRETIRPRFVLIGGDAVTPMIHRRVAEGFGTRVLETYASHEFDLIAWECQISDQLHIAEGSVLVEVLNGNKPALPGEQGEVVITALHSFTQPFIRYRLGDIVTKGEKTCSCGQPFSTIHSVQGRVMDRLIFPGKRIISPDIYFSRIEETAPWVRQYQITQENIQLISVKVVPFQAPTKEKLEELKQVLTADVPPEIEMHLSLVDTIDPGPGGKYRVSYNRVASPYSQD